MGLNYDKSDENDGIKNFWRYLNSELNPHLSFSDVMLFNYSYHLVLLTDFEVSEAFSRY